jgi:DNA-binding transcriptional regulator YiaG
MVWMTVQEVIKTVAAMPQEDWAKIQSGIADLLTGRFSQEEIAEIREALNEATAEFGRGEGMSSEKIRNQLGLI